MKTKLAESQSNISQDIVKKLYVIAPSIEEQELVKNKIHSCISKINPDRSLLNKLKVQQKGLMRNLLTGTVQVMV